MRIRRQPQRFALVIAFVCTGCAQLLGVDDFVAGPAVDAALPDADRLLAPKGPFLELPECRACSMANCAEEHRVCEEDSEWCAGSGTREPGSPIGHYATFFWPPRADALWTLEHGGDAPNPVSAVADYVSCLGAKCADACEVGRDFSCMGAFDWPGTTAGEKQLRYRFYDEVQPWPGWEVELCLTNACEHPTEVSAHDITDELGFVELTFDPGRILRESIGYVRVEDPREDHYPATFVLPPAPLESGFYDSWVILTKTLIDEPFVDAGGDELGPEDAGLWAFIRDCTGTSARHVTVEVVIADEVGQGYVPCTECGATLYTNDEGPLGFPDPARTELNSFAGRAILSSVPSRHALVIARDTKTRRAIAVQHLIAQPQTIHYLWMYPASRQQLEELPPELR
jgi:hypothetical protein